MQTRRSPESRQLLEFQVEIEQIRLLSGTHLFLCSAFLLSFDGCAILNREISSGERREEDDQTC